MTDTRSIVEQYFAAFGAGDTEAALTCVHPDAISHVDGDPIVGTVGIIRGRDAVRAWQMRFPFSFRSLDFSVERLIAGAHAAGSVARRASINGTIYEWDDTGEGPPVLFLHGLFLDRAFWSHQIAALNAHRRCVAFDMPGHWASGWRPGPTLTGSLKTLRFGSRSIVAGRERSSATANAA